jgi:cytochrome c-type biogenesis protein CcmH/NrfF
VLKQRLLTFLAKSFVLAPTAANKALTSVKAGCADGKKYREAVTAQLKEGKNREEVLNFVADTYGEQALGNPRPRGFSRMATVLPPLALVLGLLPLGLVLRSRRSNGHATEPTPASADDPRVAQALRDFDY